MSCGVLMYHGRVVRLSRRPSLRHPWHLSMLHQDRVCLLRQDATRMLVVNLRSDSIVVAQDTLLSRM